jgi:hypothetical protein
VCVGGFCRTECVESSLYDRDYDRGYYHRGVEFRIPGVDIEPIFE